MLACDICTMLDYGNISNRSFIRLDYRHSFYKRYNQELAPLTGSSSSLRQGISPHRALPGGQQTYIQSDNDYERFTNLNLGLNYTINNKYNLLLNIPYFINTDHYDLVVQDIGSPTSDTQIIQGLGDISIGAQRIITSEKKSIKHTLKLGPNLYLPTGKFDVTDALSDNIHIQPGRNIYSLDFLASYNLEEVGFWGVNLSGNYYIPLNKKPLGNLTYTYLFAKKYSFDVNGYKLFNGQIKKALILGIKNEWNEKEYINDSEVFNSGYYIIYGNLGATVTKQKILIKADTNIPLHQSLNGLQLENRFNFTLSIMYYFSKLKDSNKSLE